MFAEFALADTVYRNYYRACALAHETVIMDTLVYEGLSNGTNIDPGSLYKALMQVYPTYIIVPDVPGDMTATVEAFKRLTISENIIPPETIPIGVIQGSNQWEALRCASILGAFTNTLAIPTRSPGGIPRSHLLHMLIEDAGFAEHKFHLLGQAQTGFEDDILCASFPQVMSLDSKKAVSAAIQHLNLDTLNTAVRKTREALQEANLEWDIPGGVLPNPQSALTVHSLPNFFDWNPYPPFSVCPHSEQQRIRDLVTANIAVLTSWLK